MKKILILGGAGFIGANFIKHIIGKYNDYEVINYDVLTYASDIRNLKNLEESGRYKLIVGDIVDYSKLRAIFQNEKIDYVVNFAAETHVDRSISGSKKFIETNILGAYTLLEIIRDFRITKYVQVSTDEVYGEALGEISFDENSAISPNNPYSVTKTSADMMALAYFRMYNLPVCITRCSNNYGQFQHREKFIPLVITNAIRNQSIPIYGDGSQVRDWIYVLDHCEAIDTVLHNGECSQVYNIGANYELSNIELVRYILGYLNKPESLIRFVEDRIGHDRRYSINYTKINSQLGWQPTVKFADGISKTIDWYTKNFDLV